MSCVLSSSVELSWIELRCVLWCPVHYYHTTFTWGWVPPPNLKWYCHRHRPQLGIEGITNADNNNWEESQALVPFVTASTAAARPFQCVVVLLLQFSSLSLRWCQCHLVRLLHHKQITTTHAVAYLPNYRIINWCAVYRIRTLYPFPCLFSCLCFWIWLYFGFYLLYYSLHLPYFTLNLTLKPYNGFKCLTSQQSLVTHRVA